MTPITPEAFANHSFSKNQSGYDPAEVDAHLRRLAEIYSLLYQENASLLNRLRETEAKLHMIEEAQENALSDMKKNIAKFKNNLLDQYRLQMELIDSLYPADHGERDWTSDDYTRYIVTELKRKFSDQYEIFPETQMEFSFWNECKTESETENEKKSRPSEQNICHHTAGKKKFVKKSPAVTNLSDKDADASPKHKAAPSSESQFMLDFDHPSEQGVMLDKQT